MYLWEPGKPISPVQGRQTAIELCCWTASTLRYHLLSNDSAFCLGVDILPEQGCLIGDYKLPYTRVEGGRGPTITR